METDRENKTTWVKATVLTLSTAAMLSILILPMKSNVFLVFPILGISFNITILYLIVSFRNLDMSDIFKNEKFALMLLLYAITFSMLDCTAIIGIRLSEDIESAIFWNALQILFTSLLLVGLLAFSLMQPRPLFKMSTIKIIVFLFFSLNVLILFPTYLMNVLNGEYFHGVEKYYGIFFELSLSKSGFEAIYPFVKVSIGTLNALIVIFLSMQYIRIKNAFIKRHYSILYFGLVSIVLFELFILIVVHYLLGIKIITFFGLVTVVFSFAIFYYLVRLQRTLMEIKKLTPQKSSVRSGEVFIFPKEETEVSKTKLAEFLERGFSAIIFSSDQDNGFFRDITEKYRDKTIYITITEEGYVLENSRFASIRDIESLEAFPKNFNGIVVYSDTLKETMSFSAKTRTEVMEFYRFLFRVLRRGAVIISPVKKEHLVLERKSKTRNPVWLIRPFIVMRLEESMNEIFSKIEDTNREKFVSILRDMRKNGIPFEGEENGHLFFDLNARMDRKSFSRAIRVIGKRLEEERIIATKEYRSIMRELFSRYGDDYEATVLITDGEIHFVCPKNPREKAIKMMLFSSEFRSACMILSRTNPHILGRKYSIPKHIRLRWLTSMSDSDMAIVPHLERIKKEIFNLINEHGDAMIVLDGMEYLSRLHGFDAVMEFLWIVRDRLSMTEAVLIVPINPQIFEKRNIETLRREFNFIE